MIRLPGFGRRASRQPENISAERASALVQSGQATLIDVREPHEWAAGHAPAAHYFPLAELRGKGINSDQTVITVCRSGRRSAQAAALLRSQGIDARNLTGGMKAWQDQGLPIRRDDGSPGSVA